MFEPIFSITPTIMKFLMKIERLKEEINSTSISVTPLAYLQATSLTNSLHSSANIESNCLTLEEVQRIMSGGTVFGKEGDQQKVLGYAGALDEINRLAKQLTITACDVQRLHALVTGGGKRQVCPTSYRITQHIIKNSTRYLPPEAEDVPFLTADLIDWVNRAPYHDIPAPLVAAIAQYQLTVIRPFGDGNERAARLLAMLILSQAGYDLRGLSCLEAYYAYDRSAYYNALLNHSNASVTTWIDYFCRALCASFEDVQRVITEDFEPAKQDQGHRSFLDARKRALLDLFLQHHIITTKEVGALFAVKPRTARHICQQWVDDNFLMIVDQSKKSRTYALAEQVKDVTV